MRILELYLALMFVIISYMGAYCWTIWCLGRGSAFSWYKQLVFKYLELGHHLPLSKEHIGHQQVIIYW